MSTRRVPLARLPEALRDVAQHAIPAGAFMLRDTAARIFWEEIIGPRSPVRTGLYRASHTPSSATPQIKILGPQRHYPQPSPTEILPVLRQTPYSVPVHFTNAAGVGTRKDRQSYSPFVEARSEVYEGAAAAVMARQQEVEAAAVKAAEEEFTGGRR